MQTGKHTACQHIDLSWGYARLCFCQTPFAKISISLSPGSFCSRRKSGVVHFWRRAQPKVICNQIGSATAAAAGKIKPLRARFQFQLVRFCFCALSAAHQFVSSPIRRGGGWKGDLAAAARLYHYFSRYKWCVHATTTLSALVRLATSKNACADLSYRREIVNYYADRERRFCLRAATKSTGKKYKSVLRICMAN